MAKVSIIVPIYNIQDYLSSAVESLLRQTEKDIEIILVDDGSTDDSGNHCDQYAKKDERIKTIHKENGGLPSARNAGVKEATSEYVLFLDGDDYLCDDAIETLVTIVNNNHSDIVQFLYCEVKKSGIQQFHDKDKWTQFVASDPINLFNNLYRFGGVAASGCTKLIKRQILLEYPFENIRHEDEMWCTRVFPNGPQITYIPDILYFYVMREGSIIHSNFNQKKLDIFKIHEERILVLKKIGVNNLLDIEYSKLFFTILRLYNEAFISKDDNGCLIIENQFKRNKDEIISTKCIKGKYKKLLSLMNIFSPFIKIYILYTNRFKS